MNRRSAFFWLVIAACTLHAVGFSLTVLDFARHYDAVRVPGWSARSERTGWFVAEVDGTGPTAGRLEIGGRLIVQRCLAKPIECTSDSQSRRCSPFHVLVLRTR